jgi:outer membrane scaffolding protein for murein synthesis (MipA/OmpV family)
MSFKQGVKAALCALPLLMTCPAAAQDGSDVVIDTSGDNFTVAGGVGYTPTYEGSDDYRIIPVGAARGRVSGFGFWTRGTQLFVDVVPEGDASGIDFSLGPVLGVRLNRTSGIKDAQVKALGKLDEAWEAGGFVGISKTGVITSDYDTLGVRVSYVTDVGSAHESHVITPAVEYGTPLSLTSYVGLSLSADFVGNGYASYYFDVTPAGAMASGLSPFAAEGGFKSWSLSSLANFSLTGDLRGGLSLFVLGSYTRLQNDFKASPIVSEAGSPSQWFGAAGLAYTF